MSLTYAIPDIHGRLDLFNAAIERIEHHSSKLSATIVTLGDYIDRGLNSRQVIERLIGWDSRRFSLINLMGNHEAMMLAVLTGRAEINWWIKHGGGETLSSYDQDSARPDLQAIPADHLEWIVGLPMLHVDQHRVFVHAAIDPKLPLHQQNEKTLLWKRYSDGADVGHGQRYVVHGHDANPRAPIVGKNNINLDGMAWKTGRLIIGVFDDDRPGGPSECLEVFAHDI